jgi:hypothetical protein
MRNHFLPSEHRKKQFLRSSLSEVLSGRMVLELIISLLDFLKNDFGEIDEAIFKESEGHWKSFSASRASKKIFLRCRLSDVLSR